MDLDENEARSMDRIARTRRLYRMTAAKCSEHGATVEEAAIAAIFAAYDIAEVHAGPGACAIEWLRSGCDVLESALLDGKRVN